MLASFPIDMPFPALAAFPGRASAPPGIIASGKVDRSSTLQKPIR